MDNMRVGGNCRWIMFVGGIYRREVFFKVDSVHGRGQMDGRMDGWMDGCMDGWMDGWMVGCVGGCVFYWLVGWFLGGWMKNILRWIG